MKKNHYLGDHALATPEKPAAINGTTGAVLTYLELDEASNRFAQYLHAIGLRRGDHIAWLLENNVRCFELCWAAMRSGLLMTPINRFLSASEAAYIIEDSGAKVIVSSFAMRELAAELTEQMPGCQARLMVDGVIDGWQSYEGTTGTYPAQRLVDEWLGAMMLYSSGTTGRPKGIIRTQAPGKVTDGISNQRRAQVERYAFSESMVYLSPAPLYHTAPLGYAINIQFVGGTVVFMEKFDPAGALALIERYRVTHSQWVPTMFVRMLKLPEVDRLTYDLSSHQVAIHAAAPCPVAVKHQMIAWWGPILHEYYGATEGNGVTLIDSAEWLAHPGSVGRVQEGGIHICDDKGNELANGQIGLIYFERDAPAFKYHNDAEKTRAAQHPAHSTWTAVGDVGYLDDEGYLYLTDRKSFMIISGGVNIYPQAIEDQLVMHPSVGDAAVIGVPNDDMGEEVKALIEPARGVVPSQALADELLRFLGGKIARYMIPRSIEFIEEMPRLPTGKLYKQALRDRYWPKR